MSKRASVDVTKPNGTKESQLLESLWDEECHLESQRPVSADELVEQIKNLAAARIAGCLADFRRYDEDDGTVVDLASATSGFSLLEDIGIDHRFCDLFGTDLDELLSLKATDPNNTVIFEAIVESHVVPMSGIEVMERALGLRTK